MHGLISLFAKCTTPLRVYKELSFIKTWRHISNLKIACNKFSSKTTKWSLMGGLTVCNCCLKETSVYNALDFLLLSGQTGDGKTHLNEKFGY